MQEAQVSGELTMRWIPVADALGRTRMEAHWTVAEAAVSVVGLLDSTTHAA